jgi:hypothetical protein
VIAVVAIVVNVEVTNDDRLQRTDWRDAAARLGPPAQAVVVTPAWDEKALRLYAGGLQPLADGGASVSQITLLAEGQPPRFADPPPPPGFRLAERRVTASYELIRYVSDSPVMVNAAQLAANKLGPKPPFFLLRKDSQ